NLVEVAGRPALGAAALDAALGGVGGQRVRRHVVGVVQAAGDHRAVGVAAQELHDHFLADARDVDRSPARAGPHLTHPHPAGAALVGLALAIPVELDAHPTIGVGEDL